MTKRYSDNDWAEKNLSYKDLQGLNFEKKDLEGFNFEKAYIQSVNFAGANLKGANFKGAIAGLNSKTTFALLSFSFFLTALLIICLVIAGQLAGDRIIPKYNPGIYPNVYWEELWVAIIIILLFTIFVIANVISNQLETAFKSTFIGGLIIISLRFASILVQFILEVPLRHITVSLTSTVQGTVVGFGIGFAATVIAITISTTKIIGGKIAYITLLLEAFLTTLATSVFLYQSGAHILSSIIGGFLACSAIILGIYITIYAFSQEKKYSLVLNIAIFLGASGGTNFYNANLTNADFTEAILKNTDFRGAILTRVRWLYAKQLDLIRSGTTYLQNVQVRQLVVTGKGKGKNFDGFNLQGLDLRSMELENASFIGANFSQANLENAILENAVFIDADFYQANLSNANLSKAILVRAKFERAVIENACLTGSCIQDWIVSRETRLDEIICEYVYLKWVNGDKRDQMPQRGEFLKGDFVFFIKSLLDTIDIYHNKDINPRIALTVLNKMSRDYGEPLHIVALGKRGDKIFIKIKLPENIEPENFKKRYFSGYQDSLNLISSSPKELPLVDEIIENKLIEISSAQTNDLPPINVITYHVEQFNTSHDLVIKSENFSVREIKNKGDALYSSGSIDIGINKGIVHSEDNSMSNHYDLNKSKFGGGFAGTGGTQVGGTFNDYSSNSNSNSNLAEVVTEIKQILQQLEADLSIVSTKRAVIHRAINRIQSNPALKTMVIDILSSKKATELKASINHPFAEDIISFFEDIL